MKKKEVFAAIKEINSIVDEMARFSVDSKEYSSLNKTLDWWLDDLYKGTRYWYNRPTIHLSRRTGHYWVTF